MASKVNIRLYRDGDIKVLLEMTSFEEGWGLSEIDIRASLKVDPKGLLVAEDETGSPVGFLGLFKMSPNMTYLNVFIVRKDLRRKGIGKKIWAAMLDATKGSILALDCVPTMKEWFNDQGFSYEAYCTKSYEGTMSSYVSVNLQNSYNIVPLSDDIWSSLVGYDNQVYPYSRENALRAWLCGADRYSVVAFLDKNVVGYANFHWKSEKECNIRAVYADNDIITETLLLNLLQNIPLGSLVSFDMLGDKPLPKYFSNFKYLITSYKLFTKEISGIQTHRIVFVPGHTI